MHPRPARDRRFQTGDRLDRGFTLLEVMVSLGVLLVVAGGLATFYLASVRANDINAMNVQLLTSARAKIEQIQSIPYSQVGINASGAAAGPGYFVVDPVYKAVYSAANGDDLLSDTVTVKNGTQVTRTGTVTAVDDATDGTGNDDSDGVTDPNTGTILDYKQVTVTASATTKNGLVIRQTLTTILQGNLVNEIEGATGKDDAGGAAPQKVAKVKNGAPSVPPPPPPDCEISDAPDGKNPGKKGQSKKSEC